MGSRIAAGQKIGYAELSGGSDNFDIAVQFETQGGFQLLSFFDAMTDDLFAAYYARGISTREDMIIAKSWRDSHPVTQWDGQEGITEWVTLSLP